MPFTHIKEQIERLRAECEYYCQYHNVDEIKHLLRLLEKALEVVERAKQDCEWHSGCGGGIGDCHDHCRPCEKCQAVARFKSEAEKEK